MGWMFTIGDAWLKSLAWFTGLAVAFGLLCRLMPCNPGMCWWKNLRAAATDFFYWFIVPLFMRLFRTVMVIAGVIFLYSGRDPDLLPVQGWPLWLQCVAIVLLEDFFLYWIHRAFHTRRAWAFHAVHHSPEDLDWMSSSRFHPINNLLSFSAVDIAVLLLGFSPAAVLALVPFNVIYSAMVHANLNWTFGPFRYVFASPVFHRWHHTTREEGLDKNFASTFPVLDLVFGTFYMPSGELPEDFGTGDVQFPKDFWGQLIHPFGTAKPRSLALKGAMLVVALGLLGGGMWVTDWLTTRPEVEPLAAAPTPVQRMTVAQKALEQNDLVQVAAVLDDLASNSEQGWEQHYLRDQCRQRCVVLTGHTGAVLSAAFDAERQCVVSGGEDGTIRIWNAGNGAQRLKLDAQVRAVRGLALSADGQRMASGHRDGCIRIWETQTGKLERTLRGHLGAVLSVAMSPDGQRVVSGGADMTVKLWDAVSGHEVWTQPGDQGAVVSVAISNDGTRIVAASGPTAKVFDILTGREEYSLTGHRNLVYTMAIAADGKRFVTGSLDETIKIWDATTGQVERTLTGHIGPVYSVAISNDGTRIVSGGKDRTVRVWETATGREEIMLKGHTDSVTCVAISPKGQGIVSGSQDGTLKVWNARNCTPLLNPKAQARSAPANQVD